MEIAETKKQRALASKTGNICVFYSHIRNFTFSRFRLSSTDEEGVG